MQPDPEHWLPSANQNVVAKRAVLLQSIRAFFAQRNLVEVETPHLSAAGNTDPALDQFSTDSRQTRWLRTSPEYPLKRLLAAGYGDVYEMGRVYRCGEAGRRHNPEFTLLEWYRSHWTYRELQVEVEALISSCGALFDRQWRTQHLTYQQWLYEATGLDPLEAKTAQLKARAIEHSPGVSALDLDRDGWLDLLVSSLAQPLLPEDQLTFVSDYPASQAALSRLSVDDPRVAQRFEVFAGPLELANGYQELTDADEQQLRFEQDNKKRQQHGRPVMPIDLALLAALQKGMPDCSGVALGIDRLLMACLGIDDIRQVLAFEFNRA